MRISGDLTVGAGRGHGPPPGGAGAAQPTRTKGDADSSSSVVASRAQTSIVLACNQAVVRRGIQVLLDAVPEFSVVAELHEVGDVRRRVAGHRAKVLILDLDLETADHPLVDVIIGIRAGSPGTGIVVMGLNQDLPIVRESIGAGALAYLSASATPDDLFQAVRHAASGRTYLSRDLITVAARPSSAHHADLTSREVEILALIADGFTNLEIGRKLFRSVRTIESHRERMQMKLGHLTRAELVAYAGAHGITRR